MVMVWGEEMDSETHSNKKCGGRQKRERHVLTKKKKTTCPVKKSSKKKKKVFSFLWSPWESTVLPLPEESEARPSDQKYTAIRSTL